MECILINDGSTDASAEICRSFTEADERFKLINKGNSGVSASRNLGIANAEGKYLFFLDADDFLDADKWRDILNHAAAGVYDMTAFGYYDLFESGEIKEETFPEDCRLARALLATTLLNTCWGILFRREIIIDNNLRFNENLKTCEDAVFVLDFASRVNDYMLSDVKILYYRIHEGGVMRRSNPEDKLRDLETLFSRRESYLKEYGDESLEKEMTRQSFSVITDLLRSCASDRAFAEIMRLCAVIGGNPVARAVIEKNKIKDLPRFHKKIEYVILKKNRRFITAAYFLLKSKIPKFRLIGGGEGHR